jgi:hypothetical protein
MNQMIIKTSLSAVTIALLIVTRVEAGTVTITNMERTAFARLKMWSGPSDITAGQSYRSTSDGPFGHLAVANGRWFGLYMTGLPRQFPVSVGETTGAASQESNINTVAGLHITAQGALDVENPGIRTEAVSIANYVSAGSAGTVAFQVDTPLTYNLRAATLVVKDPLNPFGHAAEVVLKDGDVVVASYTGTSAGTATGVLQPGHQYTLSYRIATTGPHYFSTVWFSGGVASYNLDFEVIEDFQLVIEPPPHPCSTCKVLE